MTHATWRRLPLLLALPLLLGCSSPKAKEAGLGAVGGAMVGTFAGLVMSVVSGDVGSSVALGAAIGAGIGAGEGASSVRSDAKIAPKEPGPSTPEYRDSLRRRLGPDAYLAIEELAVCRHDEALVAARRAASSARRDYALAGAWVGAITEADAGNDDRAERWLTRVVEQDANLTSEEQALPILRKAVHQLGEIRYAYGHRERCAVVVGGAASDGAARYVTPERDGSSHS